MYVLARNILFQSSCALCSYVSNGLPRPAHLHKVKYSLRSDQIHCLFPCLYEQRENISLWEGVLVLEDHYIHTSRENKSFKTEYFWLIHTYKQRECHSYQYIHKIVQNQVSCHKPEKLVLSLVHYPNIMKTSNIRVLENCS